MMGECKLVVHGLRPGWACAFHPADLRVLVPRSGSVSGSALVPGAAVRRVYMGSGSFRSPRFHEEPAFSRMVPRSFWGSLGAALSGVFDGSANSACWSSNGAPQTRGDCSQDHAGTACVARLARNRRIPALSQNPCRRGDPPRWKRNKSMFSEFAERNT